MAPRSQTARAKAVVARVEPGQTNIGVLKDVLGFRLRRIQNHLAKSFGELLAGWNLRPGEFSALALIEANPGISQIELAEEGGFDKTSLVMLIDDLESRGWAERRRSTVDRRRHALFITEAGRETVRELVELAKQAEAPVTRTLSPDELEALLGKLDRIYALCFHDDPL